MDAFSFPIGKPIEILMVEDNEDDFDLAIEALSEVKVSNRIHHAKDGIEALEFLHKKGNYVDAPRPDLILLDLNMPRKDGREVLEEIKADEDLRRIPVVVLTVSQSEEDIYKAYTAHANSYITKPVDLDQFIKVVKTIEDFWLTVVKLPTG